MPKLDSNENKAYYMRIIIICIKGMIKDLTKINELVICRKDIDFSAKTVELLTRNLLNQIDIVSRALCESPLSLRNAIKNHQVKVGAYKCSHGNRWVYIHLNSHNYIIPYVVNH